MSRANAGFAVVCMAVLVAVVALLPLATNQGQVGESETIAPAESDVAGKSADEGASGDAATIERVDVRDAASSAGVQTASQAFSDADMRGFDDAVLVADYDMSGEYVGQREVDRGSGERYPRYSATYTSERGTTWFLYDVDGNWSAIPVFSNGSELTRGVVLVERETITSFDSASKTFYELAFDDVTDLEPVQVGRVDRMTLEGFSVEGLL